MPNHKAPRARAKYRARDPAVPPPRRAPWLSLHGTAGVSEAEARLATRLAWGLEALLAAALFWMALGPHRIGDCFTESDFYGSYAEGARLIQQGRLIPGRYGVVGPVYEVTLALVGFLFRRDLFVAAEAISIAATVATLHLWFSLLRRRADARIALFGVLFLVTNPVLFLFGYSASTDALALALQSGALLLLLSGTRDRAAWGAGILSALAVLTRYSAVYLFPAGLAAMLAGGALHERRGRAALLFTLGFLAPVGAWALFAMSSGGLSFQLHHNVAYEVFARAKGIPWDEYETTLEPQFKTLADVIARDPGAVFGRVLFNLVDHLRLDAAALLGWPTAIAALLGVVLGLLDGTLRRLWPLWVAGALCYLTLAPVFHSERYALPLLPVYCTLAALACASPRFALVIGREPGRWLKPALAAIPLALSIVQGVRTEVSAMRKLPVEVLECAETLRRLERPDDRVIARKNHLAYYAGVAGLPFPNLQTLPALAEYAHRHEARWLYVSWVEAELRPHFWYLLDTAGVVPGLTPRRVTRPNPAVLYEIGPGFGRVPRGSGTTRWSACTTRERGRSWRSRT